MDTVCNGLSHMGERQHTPHVDTARNRLSRMRKRQHTPHADTARNRLSHMEIRQHSSCGYSPQRALTHGWWKDNTLHVDTAHNGLSRTENKQNTPYVNTSHHGRHKLLARHTMVSGNSKTYTYMSQISNQSASRHYNHYKVICIPHWRTLLKSKSSSLSQSEACGCSSPAAGLLGEAATWTRSGSWMSSWMANVTNFLEGNCQEGIHSLFSEAL